METHRKKNMWRTVAVQGSVIAGMGTAALLLRHLRGPKVHPVVAEREELCRKHPDLAASASAFAELGDDRGLRALLDLLCEIGRLDAVGGAQAQWDISRRNAEAVRLAEDLCRRAPVATSDEVFRAALSCQDEAVPRLRGQLDDLLHNHLLAR